MTQMANGLVGHQFKVSGHGAAKALQQNKPSVQPHPALAGGPAAGEHAPTEAAAGGAHLSAVWRSSSYVETIQWELDAAHESLRQAVKQAVSSGVDRGELLQAANMTALELEAALLEAPTA